MIGVFIGIDWNSITRNATDYANTAKHPQDMRALIIQLTHDERFHEFTPEQIKAALYDSIRASMIKPVQKIENSSIRHVDFQHKPVDIHPDKLWQTLQDRVAADTVFAQRPTAVNPERIAELRAQAKAGPHIPTPIKPGIFDHMNGLDKLNVAGGILFAVAGLFGAVDNFRHATTVDENGKKKIQASQIMWGIANLSMAAVSGYFSYYTATANKSAAIH